jgi:hypothetical protein
MSAQEQVKKFLQKETSPNKAKNLVKRTSRAGRVRQ